MKFDNSRVMNFKGAFRGLRNPLNSWARSDSYGGIINYCDDVYLEEVAAKWVENENQIRIKNGKEPFEENTNDYLLLLDKYMDWLTSQGTLDTDSLECGELFYIGPNDLSLAQRMIKAGTSDRKFMRQILVSVDITGPLYWWKEFDTYKVGTVANSTSTMHKLASTHITLDCFELDDYNDRLQLIDPQMLDIRVNSFIEDLEQLRQLYNQTKDKQYWKELIRWLPNGWLQTRTVTMNYEILRNIYSQRKYHKLTEWHSFCDWVKTLPYAGELITFGID